jgi:Cupin-like domain
MERPRRLAYACHDARLLRVSDAMTNPPSPIAEYHDIDAASFRRDIVPRYQPAVLRGLSRHWSIASQSATDAIATLARLDSGRDIDAIMTPPEARGRIFYNVDMSGFNFLRNRLPVSQVLQQLARYAAFDAPPAVAVQSALIADCLPGLLADLPMPVLPTHIAPRIWIGNRIVTPTHFDESNNIACVAAGRRRFTLFPPEQIANLYIGPIDFAPTGTPISLVDAIEPDFDRFPNFRTALAHAQTAVLEPGDAIYMPALWWHHVESLTPFNVLVNYWWKGDPDSSPATRDDSMRDVLLHALVAMKSMPPAQREAWGAVFAHYAFEAGSATDAHIPPSRRGVLGELTDEKTAQVRAFLATKLK